MEDCSLADLIASGVIIEVLNSAGCYSTLALGLTSHEWYTVTIDHFKRGAKWPWLYELTNKEVMKMLHSRLSPYVFTIPYMDYLLIRRAIGLPHPTHAMDNESYDELLLRASAHYVSASLRPVHLSVQAITCCAYERSRAILTCNIPRLTESFSGSTSASAPYKDNRVGYHIEVAQFALKSNNESITNFVFSKGLKPTFRHVLYAREDELVDYIARKWMHIRELMCTLAVVRPDAITERVIDVAWACIPADHQSIKSKLASVFCKEGDLRLTQLLLDKGYQPTNGQIRILCRHHGSIMLLTWLLAKKALVTLDITVAPCIESGRLDLVRWAIKEGHICDIRSVFVCAVNMRCTVLADEIWSPSKKHEVPS